MCIDKGYVKQYKVPICYENSQNILIMYGKCMLHFKFLSCMIGMNLNLEGICMKKLTKKSNHMEVLQ